MVIKVSVTSHPQLLSHVVTGEYLRLPCVIGPQLDTIFGVGCIQFGKQRSNRVTSINSNNQLKELRE